MPKRMAICGNCGEEMRLPKRHTNHQELAEIKCSKCGSIAPLDVKLRNCRVKGLKRGFLQNNLYIKLR